MRKVIASLGAVLVLGTTAYAHADVAQIGDPSQSWSIPNDAALGEQIQEFLDTQPGEQPSFLLKDDAVPVSPGSNDYASNPTCSSDTDASCVGHPLSYQAVLPYCASATSVDCVVDFGTISASGQKTSATFARYFPPTAQNQYTGDLARHLPTGVAGSIFTLPSSPHAGGNMYYLAAALRGGASGNSNFNLDNFSVRVYPVQLQTLNYAETFNTGYSLNDRGRQDGTKYWGAAGPGYYGTNFCVANSVLEKLCASRFAFPADTTYFVKLRLQDAPNGWMHGRVANPDISITPDGSNTDIQIVANPVAVPVVYKMYNYVDMPTDLQSKYDKGTGSYVLDPNFIRNPSGTPGGRSAPNADPTKRNVINACNGWSATCMDQLKLWLPYVNNKATALLSYWSVRTLDPQEMNNASSCFSDSKSLTGIVTTDSTQYSDGPPTFNKADGTLTYQVASPHFGTNGSVFKGTYDLVMRSDVARCLYGFSKAPVSATISVTGADGTSEVATTVVGESNGWLHLSANNFEFSAPTIQVKLSQAPAVVTPTKTVPQTKTITCVKGKVIKRVIATTCPTGYKKR